MLFITPFYWVLDPETALFGIKVLEIMLVAAGVALIVLAARLAHLSYILLFAVLPALYQRQFLFMGMEAAAALFLLGVFFLFLILFSREPARWMWALAVTAFILPWVRLEYVAISISATAMLYLMEWSRKRQRLDRAASVLVRHESAAPLLASCAGILAYFAYNGLVFGGIVPVSGAVKMEWSRGYFEGEGEYDLVRNVQDIMQVLDDHVGIHGLLWALEPGCYFLLVWGFSRGQWKREDRLILAFLAGVSSLGVEYLAKIALYALTMNPVLLTHSSWYYVPAYLAVALIVPVRCWVAIYFIRRFVPQNRAVQLISRFCILAIGANFMFNQTSFAYPYRFVDRSRHSLAMDYSWEMSSYAGTQVINRILPEGSVIGSWDSGVVGYFSRFPVVNLDGLMNSYDYLRSPGNVKGSYYRKFGITHFADNVTDDDQDHDGMLFESRPFVTGEEHAFEIWHAAPTQMASGESEVAPAGHLWERMEPYFTHRTGRGAGVVVHGRMVQVSPKVCGSMQDGFMVFSWTDHDGRSGFIHPLKSTRKTEAGFCSYTFLLPPDAVRPIRMDVLSEGDLPSRLIGDARRVVRSGGFDVYDTVHGHDGDDTIDGWKGADELYGHAGNDVLKGGEGNDLLKGGQGEDTMEGGEGNDRLLGHKGNDTMRGGEGEDRLHGDTGHDLMDGGSGDDTLEGRDGNDAMLGKGDDDSMNGGDGNDYMDGGSGDDTLIGGLGDDTLTGWMGENLLTGGAGGDTFYAGNGTDRITDFELGIDKLAGTGFADTAALLGAAADGTGDEAGNVVVTFADGDLLYLEGHTTSDLSGHNLIP